MRHYSAPTRLLDWTLSPYVALYFAVESNWNSAGAVWFVRAKAVGAAFKNAVGPTYKSNWTELRKKVKGNLFSGSNPKEHIYFYEMTRQIDRMAAQQGWFSICCDGLADHSSVLEKHLGAADLCKFVIDAERKADFMRKLHLMNITAKSLFPGTDSLGRSMEEIARLSIRFEPTKDSAISLNP
jgi:hypothetical protein